MQLSIFEEAITNIAPPKVAPKPYDYKRVLRDLNYKNSQHDFVVPTASNITTYKSGSSAKSDILGYIEANSPIGITAIDASAPVRNIVSRYISTGGRVFVDSGAFRNFKSRLKDPTVKLINFDHVFACYEDIIAGCTNTQSLIVVAPDSVGDQEYSYQLLVRYLPKIKNFLSFGVNLMVPLQKGELSIAKYYKKTVRLLGCDFICGLPSNAKALSKDEVFQFLNLSFRT